jgi:large subunit ribosomal protein L4
VPLEVPTIGGQPDVRLDESVFGEPFHRALVHETVRAELAARRRGSASTRTRAEVAMTGAKAWRQKGTGRARVGQLSTPQRTGGGVAFGPKPRDYTVKVNRKARRKALRAALSLHAGRGSVAVVEPGAFETPSTKAAAEALEGLDGEGSVVMVLADGEEGCAKSFRNIAGVSVVHVDDVGVADLLASARLLASPAALERLTSMARPPRTSAEEAA